MIKENLIPLFQVDAFTDKPFAGNPAAVCLLQREAEFHWMRAVGAEMNLSETAFVQTPGRRFRTALVHANYRSGFMRSCYPSRRAYIVGARLVDGG